LHPVGLNQDVDDERASSLPLTVQAVATVREERIGRQPVANGAAGAAAFEWIARHAWNVLGPTPARPADYRGSGLDETESRLRDFALTLPGAWEDFPWGERVAKVRKKVFVFLGHDEKKDQEPSLVSVKLVESHGHALAIEGASPTGYGLGRAGWVNVPVQGEGVTPELLCEWIEESYRIVAPKRLVAELDGRS
jgi:predicted DNA-binding protein (MmcQ/YjbR family)